MAEAFVRRVATVNLRKFHSECLRLKSNLEINLLEAV